MSAEQRLTPAAILAIIDELRETVPEFSDIYLERPWAVASVSAASAGVVTGVRTHRSVDEAARATAEATFHVKPLNYGNRVLAALLAHTLLSINGEETTFAETVELVGLN